MLCRALYTNILDFMAFSRKLIDVEIQKMYQKMTRKTNRIFFPGETRLRLADLILFKWLWVGQQAKLFYKSIVPLIFAYKFGTVSNNGRRNKRVGNQQAVAQAITFQQLNCHAGNFLIYYDYL